MVRNLLASHDIDPRYQHRDVKARIAKLYVPLIGIVIDALPQLCIESRPTVQLQQLQQSVEMKDSSDAQGIDQNVAMAIAGSSIYSVPGESSVTVTFLQRISIACYAEHCISYSKSVRLSVRPSVHPSHAGTESK